MPQPHHDAQPSATTRRVFRQPSAHLTGWLFIAGLAIACVLYLFSDPSNWLVPIVLAALVGLLVWVLLVRPCVVVAKDGVELQNLVRDVTIPWAHVDLTRRRWNLKIYTVDGNNYGSWAISQQRPHRQSGGMGGGMSMTPTPGSLRHPTKVNTTIEERDSSAESVGALIDQTKAEYDQLIASGELSSSKNAVQVQPAVPSIVALALVVVLAVVCALTLG